MFDPKELFPLVRNTTKKGTDAEIMAALQKLAQAHPELSAEQAAAALQQYAKQKGAQGGGNSKLSAYLAGGTK